jgi:hypothetical protein
MNAFLQACKASSIHHYCLNNNLPLSTGLLLVVLSDSEEAEKVKSVEKILTFNSQASDLYIRLIIKHCIEANLSSLLSLLIKFDSEATLNELCKWEIQNDKCDETVIDISRPEEPPAQQSVSNACLRVYKI